MAIWLVRAGSHVEYEPNCIHENRVYATLDELDVNVGKLSDRSELVGVMKPRRNLARPLGQH